MEEIAWEAIKRMDSRLQQMQDLLRHRRAIVDRTLLDEHLRVKGRTTWYETLEEMQTDLEAYLETYNRKRPHRSRAMEGRTPY